MAEKNYMKDEIRSWWKNPIGRAALSNPLTAMPALQLAALKGGIKKNRAQSAPAASGGGYDPREFQAAIDAAIQAQQSSGQSMPNIPAIPVTAAEPQVPHGDGDAVSAYMAMMGGGGPAPDRAAYVQPFDDAEARSRETFTQAQGTIGSQYDALKAALGANHAQAQGVQQRLGDERLAQYAAAAAQIGELNSDVLRDIQLQGGGNAGAVTAEIGNREAEMRAQQARQQGLADEMAQSRQRSHDTRLADSDLLRQSALADAQNNLNSILNQIGVGRAQAERQYTNDAQDYARSQASARLSAVKEAMSQADDEAKAAEKFETERQKILKSIESSPYDEFMAGYADRAARFPKSVQVFESITNAAKGKGQMGLAQALRILGDHSKDISSGNYHLDYDDPESRIRNRINPTVLENWLRAYYDTDSKSPSKRKAEEMGLDLAALLGG